MRRVNRAWRRYRVSLWYYGEGGINYLRALADVWDNVPEARGWVAKRRAELATSAGQEVDPAPGPIPDRRAEVKMERMENLRTTVAQAIAHGLTWQRNADDADGIHVTVECDGAANSVLAALGLDDLDAAKERVAEGLYESHRLGDLPFYPSPKTRKAIASRCVAYLFATGESGV